jgi:hypothetical protein
MLRSRGIPANLIKGNSIYVNVYHICNEIYDNLAGKSWCVFFIEKYPQNLAKYNEY